MEYSIEITPIDDQIPLLPQTENDEIEEGGKVDHLIKKETNGQDLLGSVNKKIDEMFEDLDNSSINSCTIFKVYVGLRESNPGAYTPKMVSIGPYHKNDPQLRSMEKYKVLYLRRFLRRKEELDVKSCISELEKLKEKAIKCYDDIEDLNNDSSTGHQIFLEILLLDGCFVIEFIRELCKEFPEGENNKIINVACIRNQILGDLLLLENQLPFFVLNKLHNMTANPESEKVQFIKKLQLVFRNKFSDISNPASMEDLFSNYDEGNIKHLLHILHMSFHRNPSMDAEHSMRSLDTDTIWRDHDKILPNATELSEAGVSFKKVGSINYFRTRLLDKDKSEETTSLFFDIKFKNGVMNIPCFQIVADTESLLRNLIAYEQQSSVVYPKYFSDFAVFMDFLVDSDKDVNLLRMNGIVVSWMEDDKEVASFFNRIGKGVIFSPDDFYYKDECRKAFQHCEKPWNRMKANLKHNYFSSLWAGAATVGAIVLLILTTIQTVRAFHK